MCQKGLMRTVLSRPLVHTTAHVLSSLCCYLPCSFANKQDGSSALSDQDLSERLGLEQLIKEAGVDQCQVVSASTFCARWLTVSMSV